MSLPETITTSDRRNVDTVIQQMSLLGADTIDQVTEHMEAESKFLTFHPDAADILEKIGAQRVFEGTLNTIRFGLPGKDKLAFSIRLREMTPDDGSEAKRVVTLKEKMKNDESVKVKMKRETEIPYAESMEEIETHIEKLGLVKKKRKVSDEKRRVLFMHGKLAICIDTIKLENGAIKSWIEIEAERPEDVEKYVCDHGELLGIQWEQASAETAEDIIDALK